VEFAKFDSGDSKDIDAYQNYCYFECRLIQHSMYEGYRSILNFTSR